MHLFETFTWCAKIRGIFCCAFRVLIDWADKLQSRGLISALTIWRWTTRMRAQMKRSPPNAKINACNKKVFFLCLCENSSKTGFAHYMDGCLLRESLPLWKSTFFLETHIWGNSPSPWSNFSVEIELLPGNRLSPWKLTSEETHLLHSRTSPLKSTENRTTSWKSTFSLETHNCANSPSPWSNFSVEIDWKSNYFLEIDFLPGNSHLWKLTFSMVELLCWNRLITQLLPGNRPSSWKLTICGNSPSPWSNFSVEIDWKSNYFLEFEWRRLVSMGKADFVE